MPWPADYTTARTVQPFINARDLISGPNDMRGGGLQLLKRLMLTVGDRLLALVNGGGLRIPVFTTAQRDAISDPKRAELIANITTGNYEAYNGSGWTAVAPLDSTGVGLSQTTLIGDGLAAGAFADFTVPVPSRFFLAQTIQVALASRITAFSLSLYQSAAERDANAGTPALDDPGLVFADFNITDADAVGGGTYQASVLGLMNSTTPTGSSPVLYGRVWNEDGLGASGDFVYAMEAYPYASQKAV